MTRLIKNNKKSNKTNIAKITISSLVLIVMVFAIFLYPRQDMYVQATSASSMAVMETTTGRVLNSKNMHTKRPMASTTKIVTAIVIIENADLNRIIKVAPQAVGIEGSSIYLAKDESISIKDLLYGLMLQSGNDAAVALAIAVGGSVEKFATMMNDFARSVGAENSNFINPHGLHHDDHYTTAYDLALLSAYAMNNPIFKEIASTKTHKATWEGRDYPRVINNKNKILNLYKGGNGVKTGFTKKAGRCLVSSAERNGMQIVSVVLNCGPMFEDCMSLMDTAFAQFTMTDIVLCGQKIEEIPVITGKADTVGLKTLESFRYPLKDEEITQITHELKIPQSLNAPVIRDKAIGELNVFCSNRLLFSTKVFTMDDVRRLTLVDRIERLLSGE